MKVGDSLTYRLGPSDDGTEILPESITLRILSRIERFVNFNETRSALEVNGALMTENDAGTWEISIEVYYSEPLHQVFRSQFKLHIGMDNDEMKEDKPPEFDAPLR